MDLFTIWNGFLLSLGIYAVVFVVRKVVEFILKGYKLSNARWWRELALPVMPVLLGVCVGLFAETYPYPEGIKDVLSRVLYGAVCGLVSSLSYRVLKKVLVKKAKEE